MHILFGRRGGRGKEEGERGRKEREGNYLPGGRRGGRKKGGVGERQDSIHTDSILAGGRERRKKGAGGRWGREGRKEGEGSIHTHFIFGKREGEGLKEKGGGWYWLVCTQA